MSEQPWLPELFISIDIETDGPVPGTNSMLSLGAVAFDQTAGQVDTWYRTLFLLEGSSPDADTMAWWSGQPDAWAEVTSNRELPREAIPEFVAWCDELRKRWHAKLVAVAWPAVYDFPFITHYCHRFAGRNPFGFSCLDIRSYAAGLARAPDYYGLANQKMRGLAGDVDRAGLRPHFALDDAIEQGRLFMALRQLTLVGPDA